MTEIPVVRSSENVWHRRDDDGCYAAESLFEGDYERRELDHAELSELSGHLCRDCFPER